MVLLGSGEANKIHEEKTPDPRIPELLENKEKNNSQPLIESVFK